MNTGPKKRPLHLTDKLRDVNENCQTPTRTAAGRQTRSHPIGIRARFQQSADQQRIPLNRPQVGD
jgi:hypothetical protein